MQPFELVLLALMLAWREIGLGYHAEVVMAVNPMYMLDGAKILYVATLFFDGSICLPKLAAIFFYARVFRSNNRAFRLHLWAAGALVGLWLVSAWLTTIFQCTPIEKAWNAPLEGHCVDTYRWYLATAALSTVIDFYILLLPVPMIWALKISRRRRIYLLAAFFLAYSVIVISIGRLISTAQLIPTLTQDLTWKFPLYTYWVSLEGSVSIISISVPNKIALVKKLLGGRWPGSSGSGRGSGSGETKITGYNSASIAGTGVSRTQVRAGDTHGFERLSGSKMSEDSDSQRTLRPTTSPTNDEEDVLALGQIHVQTDINVSSQVGQAR
jgi:hypothetical protein